MNTRDPIANLIINIKNAVQVKQQNFKVIYSSVLENIVKLLVEQGYLAKYVVEQDKNKKYLVVSLKYNDERKSSINEIKQVSKPGLKQYYGCDDLPYVKNGFGMAIVSTNLGIVSDKVARDANVGGEVLALV
jgi:small subunit ribosomal protein S8